ncbi:MAG: hypothetical protein AAF999_10125 [Pseudomonadota bacterium]
MADERFIEYLDAISRCFIEHNFALWKDRVIYPFSLITSAGPVVILDDAGLRENFELYLSFCDTMQIDSIVRTPVCLEDCRDGSWMGTYETNLLSHGVRATAPYVSTALLQDVFGKFKMKSILNARGHHD